MAWATIAVTVVGAVGSAVAANQTRQANKGIIGAQKDALAQQQDLLANLKYEPIDIAKLQADATAAATQNATNSLALERSLQPNVAATREATSKRVSDELALGGNLSPDVANQVAMAARTRGSSSGVGGNAAPITAALTGQSAQSLLQQRINNANGLLAANPLPVAGLDPGSLASAEIANTTNQNQFNIAKAGGQANLIQSGANITGAELGAKAQSNAMWTQLAASLAQSGLSAYGKSLNTKTTTPTNPGLVNPNGLQTPGTTFTWGSPSNTW